MTTGAVRGTIRPVGYSPPREHDLGIEVYSAGELARRVASVSDRGFERVDLLCLLYVTRGRYEHVVDFETHVCLPGSAVTVQPGQVHRFGPMSGWDGWFVVVRSEHSEPRWVSSTTDARELPAHVKVGAATRPAVEGTLRQMADDIDSDAPVPVIDALLLHQFRGLSIRLQMATDGGDSRTPSRDPVVVQRFRGFRDLVEREHGRWHSVTPYARELGCSQRTVTRASEAVSGSTAKAFITRRVVLEAERLLAHTTDPVVVIGATLGFDEPTNFVKWFRRETGLTPGAFRSRHRG